MERIALEHSHPLWLVERWIEEYGEGAAEAICRANNEPPAVSVRVNTTMISREGMLAELEQAGVKAAPSALSPEGILVYGGGNMALTDWYRDGQISIQDESSMLVARRRRSRTGDAGARLLRRSGRKNGPYGRADEGPGRNRGQRAA